MANDVQEDTLMGPNTFRFTHPRLLMAELLMLFGFGALFTSASAQDEVEPEETTVATEAPVEDLATPEAGTGDDVADDSAEVAEDDAAVAGLPDTGSGSDEDSTAIVLTASALAAATLGLAAIGARRLIGRNEA